jgi:hypothetical protein
VRREWKDKERGKWWGAFVAVSADRRGRIDGSEKMLSIFLKVWWQYATLFVYFYIL